MKRIQNHSAQGDVLFERVGEIPAEVIASQDAKAGPVVLAHSESGHHHQFGKDSGVTLFTTADPFVCYLRCEGPGDAQLEHLRPWDTHEAVVFPPGTYRVNRQAEVTPEGWRVMVQD